MKEGDGFSAAQIKASSPGRANHAERLTQPRLSGAVDQRRAAGYHSKETNPEMIVRAVQAAASGEELIDRNAARSSAAWRLTAARRHRTAGKCRSSRYRSATGLLRLMSTAFRTRASLKRQLRCQRSRHTSAHPAKLTFDGTSACWRAPRIFGRGNQSAGGYISFRMGYDIISRLKAAGSLLGQWGMLGIS